MLAPLDLSVWLWRCFSCFVVVSSCYFINKASTRGIITEFTCIDFALSVFGLQMSQGMPKGIFKNTHINVLLVFLLVATFFQTSNYLCNIKAIFINTKTSARIESLAEAMKDPNVQLIIGKGTHLESLLNNGNSNVLKEAFKRVKMHPENLIDRRHARSQCLDRVRDFDNMACLSLQSIIVEYISLNRGHGLYYTKESVTSALGHWVIRKDFRYKALFNKEIAKLIETGMA